MADETTIPDGCWQDTQGRFVPLSKIAPVDRLRTETVRSLIELADKTQAQLATAKREAFTEVEALLQLSLERFGVSIGGARGNVQLLTYDGLLRVDIQRADRLQFDERIKAAEALILECVNKWSEGASDNLKVIVQDAFRTDKSGELSVSRIVSLRRVAIDDPQWTRAMDAINESLTVAGTARYIRFYRRASVESPWEPISLDIAKL